MIKTIKQNSHRMIKQSVLFACVFVIGSCSLVQEQNKAQSNAMSSHTAEMSTALNIQDHLTFASYLNEKSVRQTNKGENKKHILSEQDLLNASLKNIEESFTPPRLKRAEGESKVYHYSSPLCQLDIYFTQTQNTQALPAFFTMREAHNVKNTQKEVTLRDCLVSLHKSIQTAQN